MQYINSRNVTWNDTEKSKTSKGNEYQTYTKTIKQIYRHLLCYYFCVMIFILTKMSVPAIILRLDLLFQGQLLGHFVQIRIPFHHYNDLIMGKMASQITSLTIVYSIV